MRIAANYRELLLHTVSTAQIQTLRQYFWRKCMPHCAPSWIMHLSLMAFGAHASKQ
jgi:hypothetical protein